LTKTVALIDEGADATNNGAEITAPQTIQNL
jgi:hypothetical protein